MEKRKNEETSGEKPVNAILTKDGKVIIKEERKTEIHNKGYYGEFEEGILELKPVEALLLLERKKIIVHDENGEEVDFRKLTLIFLEKDENIWTKFLVYKDLRSRGYTVALGYEGEMDFRIYERGAEPSKNASKYLIYVVQEGKHLSLTQLEKIISIGASSRKKTALAVVDRQGDATYYFVSEVNL